MPDGSIDVFGEAKLYIIVPSDEVTSEMWDSDALHEKPGTIVHSVDGTKCFFSYRGDFPSCCDSYEWYTREEMHAILSNDEWLLTEPDIDYDYPSEVPI